MESSAFCSLVLLVVYIPLRLALPEGAQVVLSPFSSAITILGGHVLFLAHLILSSYSWNDRSNRWLRYFFHNGSFLVLVIIGMAVGFIHGFRGMANTSIVYLVLWGFEKFYEIQAATVKSLWVYVFFVSAFIVWGCIEINKHPGFVVSMFQSKNY